MLNKFIICLVILSQILTIYSIEDPLFQKFQEFSLKYNKVYPSYIELQARFENFKKNFFENAFSGEAKKGITEFFDLSAEELKMLKPRKCTHDPETPLINLDKYSKDVPDTLDWRTNGKVSPVKNQSQLDTSFAFSSVANLESQSLIRYNKANLYSERQILDCDTDTSHLMESALLYVEKYGIESEYDYGKGNVKDQCKYDPSKVISKVKAVRCYEDVLTLTMKTYLNSVGPLSIGISAIDLTTYMGGVLECKVNDVMDLGVLLIGYGHDNGNEYWLVKNSWGKSWGEGGFAKISMAEGKNCGIGQYVVDADME